MASWARDGGGVPERLARFAAAEWPGGEPLKDWCRACLAWLAAHPGERLPWGEFGDKLDVLQRCREYRLAGPLS